MPGILSRPSRVKETSSRVTRRKRGSSGCGRDPRASSRVEMGMSGNFLICSKGVKDPFEVPEFRCDLPQDASAEMGLTSPGGVNLLDFPELHRCSRVTTGTSGTRSCGLRKGQSPCELRGASRDSSPIWSRGQILRIPLQCLHGPWGTSRVSTG